MLNSENYRSAAIHARVMGSNRGSFTVERSGQFASPFTSEPAAHVVRVSGTWRVLACDCQPYPEPCSSCLILFVGITPGDIRFPSRHTETDWQLAHTELMQRSIQK